MTYPLSVNLRDWLLVGRPSGRRRCSILLVTVIFRDDVTITARSRVLETPELPDHVDARGSPQLESRCHRTCVGYQHHLRWIPEGAGKAATTSDVSVRDPGLVRAIPNAVPGVARWRAHRRFVRQYRLSQLVEDTQGGGVASGWAVSATTSTIGEKTVEENGMEFVVRGVGSSAGVGGLEKIALADTDQWRTCVL